MSHVLEERLADARAYQAPEFAPIMERGIIHLFLLPDDPPLIDPSFLPLLQPDLFSQDETAYLMAWIQRWHKQYGVIPTRGLLRDRVCRHLTVDDPYKDVLEILDEALNPRDVPVIKDNLQEWIQRRIANLLYSDETIAAVVAGDHQPIYDITERLKAAASIAGPSLDILSYEELGEHVAAQEWLVEDVALAGQPLFIAGPKKALKTGLALDLAVAIASGTKFLGHFPAPKPRKVLFFSGESGKDDVHSRITAIAKARGLTLPDTLRRLRFCFDRPRLSDAEYLATLSALLRQHSYQVLIIDPLYLSLLSGSKKEVNAGNLYQMGALFGAISQACQSAGVTPILCHHFKKSAGESLDLDDMTFSGAAEFARQSILVRRAVPFTTPENNVLTMRLHGAGRGDTYRVLVNEGKGMASWGVLLEREAAAVQAERQEKKNLQDAQLVDGLLVAITAIKTDGRKAMKTTLREEMGVSGAKVTAALNLAREEGLIEEYRDGGYTCYRRKL